MLPCCQDRGERAVAEYICTHQYFSVFLYLCWPNWAQKSLGIDSFGASLIGNLKELKFFQIGVFFFLKGVLKVQLFWFQLMSNTRLRTIKRRIKEIMFICLMQSSKKTVMVPGFSGLFLVVSPSLLIARAESGLCVHLCNLLACHRWLLTCHPSSLTAYHTT